jgi:CheY-like chemotaxis protein
VQAKGDQLYFAVRDTGIGISPDRLAAIFDPFTQADASMTRRFGGTGLGTTISKQLVELMDGKIWAESEPGKGTTFHVLLPLALARNAQQQPRVRSAAVLPPLSVLAADDVPQNLLLLQLLLARRGHTLTTVSDGAAVVDMAARGGFDLILMDFQMPVLDGLSACRAIRAEEQASGRQRVPVIAMTASVLPEHRTASTEAGMDGFATKPVDWYALSHEIARVLGMEPTVADSRDEAPGATREVLNRRAGLYRWSGNEDAYGEALDHFERQHAGLAGELAGLAAGDLQALRMTAHRVRGVAANVGLEQLADALAVLERGAAVPPGESTSPAALEQATAALEQALAAIRASQGSAAQAAAVKAGVDLARARRAGKVLLEALGRGALDDAALAGMASALAGHPLADRVGRVNAALADFDFDLALDQLTQVMAQLGEADQQESTQ